LIIVGNWAALNVGGCAGDTAEEIRVVACGATGDVVVEAVGRRWAGSIGSDGIGSVGVTAVGTFCDADVVTRDGTDTAKSILTVEKIRCAGVLRWFVACVDDGAVAEALFAVIDCGLGEGKEGK